MTDRKRSYPTTPGGHYFLVRGRLWRTSNPALGSDERERLVKELMAARRAIGVAKRANDADAAAYKAVDRVKVAMGERGPVWWGDGAPDLNRQTARTTPYADWFIALD